MITKADILANVSAEIIASKDEAAIAAAFNIANPRTKLVKSSIGIGTILEVLGQESGNTFLDYVWSNPDFRWVKLVIEKGELNTGSELVQGTIDALVSGGLLPPEKGYALKATGIQADPISSYEVAQAFERG